MSRFFLRKGIFAIIAMSVLSIAFFGYFHDSDDDDDDTSSSESASDKSVGILNGAYLDGLSEIKVSAALKSGVYSDGADVSGLFSISTNSAKSARLVSNSYVSSFGATISKIFSDYFIVALSGKVALSDSSLKISVALPADKTSSGSALTVSPLTVNTGSAAAVSTASLALSSGSAPSTSELAGKTFKYVKCNSQDGVDVVFYQFNESGSSATHTRIKEGTLKGVYTAPYDESTGYLGLYHSSSDADSMNLIKIGGNLYFYDTESEYSAQSSSSLFTRYNIGDDGSYMTLSKDGSISGYYTDTKDGVTTTGDFSGNFVNNGGIVTIYTTVTSNGEEIFSLDEPCIYSGTALTTGGAFVEYLGSVPTE